MTRMLRILAFTMALLLALSCAGLAASGEPAAELDGVSVTVSDKHFTGSATPNELADFTITSDNEYIVGISASAEPDAAAISIHDGRIELIEKGTAIAVGDNAKVDIDRVVVWNKGNADGVSASGSAEMNVRDTVIYGEQDFDTYRRGSPFALGLAGSMRVTNAVGASQVTYEDSLVVSGSWAPLSTDAGSGVCLTTRNVLAGIGWLEEAQEGKPYTATRTVNGVTYGFTLGDSANRNSGYVSYCDSGFHNYYYDSEFYGTDYVIILSTGEASATMENDTCWSDRVGIMWHKNQGGTVDITGGSLHADQCLFMMKGYSDLDTNGCFANLIVDGAELTTADDGVLLQLMTSDDCGLDYEALQIPAVEDDFSQVECLLGTQVQKTYSEGFPPTTMYVYDTASGEVGVSAADMADFEKNNPDAKPVLVDYVPQQTSTATFKNLSVDGDIYNAVWQAWQAVDVSFDKAEITGVISSAWANHVDADGKALPGGTVIEADSSLDCHLGMGRVKNTAAPAVNNPVYLTLENGSVWNVSGVSYLSKLALDESSSIVGATMTVNGVETPIKAGSYEGEIVLTPDSVTLSPVEISGDTYVSLDALLAALGQ